jgi:phosphoribosylamine--glycine ligase
LAFGPGAKAAMLEGSKSFSKEFMQRHNIPTAGFSTHTNLKSALTEIENRNGPCVVKADGLAAGKGVLLCKTKEQAIEAVKEILGDQKFGDAGKSVVIEDFLNGEEASVLAISDGEKFIPLIAAQDHKAAFENDTGPNTGGMGAYAPAPVVTKQLEEKIINQVLKPTIEGMNKEGTPFRGILYAGLMIDGSDIYVLEYNVRFGDPECQPLLTLMKSDLAPLLVAASKGSLGDASVKWKEGFALCVVQTAGGYPGPYEKGNTIHGLKEAEKLKNVIVFHAGTKKQNDKIVTNGGRVLGITGTGSTLKEAADTAYNACSKISWQNMRMRKDIGHRALK